MTAPKRILPAERDRILALRAAGWTIQDIARRVRRMNSAITDVLKATGQPTRHGGNGWRGVPRNPELLVKRCTSCHLELPARTEFYAHSTGAHGRAARCRECQKDSQFDRYRRQRDAKRCGEVPKQQPVTSSVEPSKRTYLPHEWHHIEDPVLRLEAETQYLAELEPKPLFFSDGRRMDD